MYVSGPGHVLKIRLDEGKFELIDKLLVQGLEHLDSSPEDVKTLVMYQPARPMIPETRGLPRPAKPEWRAGARPLRLSAALKKQ
jgi:hypothetical protein